MGLHSQVVIAGHLSLDDLCQNLVATNVARAVHRRPTRSADYWFIELVDERDEVKVINVFLNSFANGDVQELGLEESTLLTMELGPSSEAILGLVAKGRNAWVRRHEGLPWERHGATV